MQAMGPVQRGLPLLYALPASWHVIVIDIKDCFFSIPLFAKDSERFTFTLPSKNHEEPNQRFEWVVLPQGMTNSPTMCQLYVGQTIESLRKEFPILRCLHYIYDVLLAAKEEKLLEKAYIKLIQLLEKRGLFVAPEKVQKEKIVSYLGTKINGEHIIP